MDKSIIIKNKNITNYVMLKLNKLDNNFTLDELSKITDLVIDEMVENNYTFVSAFSNLE